MESSHRLGLGLGVRMPTSHAIVPRVTYISPSLHGFMESKDDKRSFGQIKDYFYSGHS
jgi:hypothetical protein